MGAKEFWKTLPHGKQELSRFALADAYAAAEVRRVAGPLVKALQDARLTLNCHGAAKAVARVDAALSTIRKEFPGIGE